MPDLHGSSAATAAAAVAAARQATFQQLRPICAGLLQKRTAPHPLAEALTTLCSTLASLDPYGLGGCWDYIIFPLSLILDSILPARGTLGPGGTVSSGAGTGAGVGSDLPVPAARSDKVAEAALGEWDLDARG